MDFANAVTQAQKLPELPEDMEKDLPDFLKQDPVHIARRAQGGGSEGAFPGATQYDAAYNCERLIIGQIVEGYDKGNPMFRDVDNSTRLKEIMDLSLQGKAIILKRQETILKDGTVVVWIEWAEHKKPAARADPTVLTEKELRTPSPDVTPPQFEEEFDESEGEEF